VFKYFPRFNWSTLLDNNFEDFNFSEVVASCLSEPIDFSKLGDTMIEVMTRSALSLLRSPRSTDFEIYQTVRTANVFEHQVYTTASEFSHFLFSLNSGLAKGHSGLLWLKKTILDLLHEQTHKDRWKAHFCEYLDTKIYMSAFGFACFPVPAQQRVYIVVPLLKINTRVRPAVERKLVSAYKVRHFHSCIGNVDLAIKCVVQLCRALPVSSLSSFKNMDLVFKEINEVLKTRNVIVADLRYLFL
jgi:hypothetical protein